MALKEAAAALSPIVRNRLHGIPQYILEYADLVVSNAVERPFLKPILIAGPVAGEKAVLLQTLADEFPDVFAFPAVVTDEAEGPLPDPGDGRCAAAWPAQCPFPLLRREAATPPVPSFCSSF